MKNSDSQYIEYSKNNKKFLTDILNQDSSICWGVNTDDGRYFESFIKIRDCKNTAHLDFDLIGPLEKKHVDDYIEKVDNLINELQEFKKNFIEGLEHFKINCDVYKREKDKPEEKG